jgi:feruloyl-CoA synthase
MGVAAMRQAFGGPRFAEPRTLLERRADGSLLMRSPVPLPEPARCVGDWLAGWAARAPDRTFLAERASPDLPWTRLTYGEALARVRAVAACLLSRGLSPAHPVAILCDNGIDHALMALGAMHAGIPVATISPAYSLMSKDHAKLVAMIELLDPGLILVSDDRPFAAALAAIDGRHRAILVASLASADGVLPFDELLSTPGDGPSVDAAFASVTPDTVARLLFTSGSTGTPKAVINTHRMLTSNQEAKALVWPFLNDEPPVLVDWLPWSHTFGANHNLNMVLRNGGTLHIDAGRPAPHLFHVTAANLKEVGPSLCFNVPRGYDMLIAAMRQDTALRDRFFGSTRLIFYAGAALPQNLWNALAELSNAAVGRTVPMVSAWGSTETAPLATDCHFQAERSGNIGLPVPGTELKLVPSGDKLEIRVRGPNVTPGYWKNEALTRAAFDEEGFYRIGDAVRLADPERPEMGLYFDGRVAEDFKLASGTWVSVGDLRVQGIAALDPVAQDIVVTGHDRDEAGFLVFPNLAACRVIAGLGEDAPARAVLDHANVRDHVRKGLAALKAKGGGSSRYATRARLMEHPAAVDAGEITDKGYVNQRAVLANRTGELRLLQSDDASAFVALEDA